MGSKKTLEEIEREKECVKELKRIAIVFFQNLAITGDDSVSKIEQESEKEAKNSLKEIYQDKSIQNFEKVNGFSSTVYRRLVREEEVGIPKHRFATIASFIFNKDKTRYKDTTKDYFSLLAGYRGYNHFKQEIDNVIGTFSSEEINHRTNSEVHDSPLKEKALLDFFKNSCYLYAYDEDLCGVNKETDAYRYYFPSIDRLVLSLEKDQFRLENIKTDQSKKEDHTKGVVTWCKKPTGNKNHANAIDITFLESRTKLILRIHIPSRKEKNTKKFNLLLGAFLIAHEHGDVAMGSVVIKKIPEGEKDIKTDKFDFGLPENDIEIDNSIKGYLFDRYKNWLKVPSNQFNIDLFDKWLDQKKGKNYTKQQITSYDFLITHPRSVIPEEKRSEFVGIIDRFIEDKDGYIDNFSGLLEKQKELLKKYIDKKQKNNRFFRFPDPHKKIPKHPKYNRNFLLKIAQSLNIVIVIPKYDYKGISSIFMVIGYCIALKRRTFVFFQDGVERPKMLKDHEDGVNLFVDNYSKIEDIAELLVTKYFRDTWIKFACKELGEDIKNIPPMD